MVVVVESWVRMKASRYLVSGPQFGRIIVLDKRQVFPLFCEMCDTHCIAAMAQLTRAML